MVGAAGLGGKGGGSSRALGPFGRGRSLLSRNLLGGGGSEERSTSAGIPLGGSSRYVETRRLAITSDIDVEELEEDNVDVDSEPESLSDPEISDAVESISVVLSSSSSLEANLGGGRPSTDRLEGKGFLMGTGGGGGNRLVTVGLPCPINASF